MAWHLKQQTFRLVLIFGALTMLPSCDGSPRTNAEILLNRFPGRTAGVLSSLAKHLRVDKWSFKLMERIANANRFRIVVPSTPEDVVVVIENVTANWSSYSAPIIDLDITNATIYIGIDEIFRRREIGSTNWHRLRRSGFPPVFPTSATRSVSRFKFPSLSATSPPKFRNVCCNGNCVVVFSATVMGRQISEGLPRITLPGKSITAMWEKALGEWRDEQEDRDDADKALGVEEAGQALVQVVLGLVLDKVEALAEVDEGAILAAVRSAIEKYIREVLGKLESHLHDIEETFTSKDSSFSDSGEPEPNI
mmetsp:Transcript_15866/g.31680  ORF Transcript_15866/g.31680 Transcript_15866/m.31680 type:complete len:308 (+) Transcript_15866:126-1049(+)